METLSARQLADEGQAAYEKGDFQSAAALFKAAADGFLSAGDEFTAAEMKNNCSVAFLKSGDAASALEAAWGTDEVFSEHEDVKRQAMGLGNQAAALEGLGRVDEAILAYEKAAELFKTTGEYELRAYVYQSISSLQMKQRHYLEAYATMRAGVQGINKPNLQQRLLRTLLEIPFKFLR